MLQLSDGVKKWSVILPTAPLPKPWRIAARERLLARLELAKAQRAKLLIIAHPKSGFRLASSSEELIKESGRP